jgi:thiol-disulfide isomerase/thioredoxin
MHDGSYHAVFNFSSKLLPAPVFYEGTFYFSKDSATVGSVGDFIAFEKDTVPVFGYLCEYFYKFDAAKKQYTSQFLTRQNFYQKSTFDFQNFLAVRYLLNNLQYPFDDYFDERNDSAFCNKVVAGYMKTDTLRSVQQGDQLRKSYSWVRRSKAGDTIEIHNSDMIGSDVMSKSWLIDRMKIINNGEQYVQKKINQYTTGFKQIEARDLDDINAVAPPSPVIEQGKKLLLDTVPVNTVLKTMEYKPYSLDDDNAGAKLLLLDFWFANCHPCIEAMPKLETLHKTYGNKGLAVIGINPFDYDMDIVKGILAKNGVDYSICLDSEAELVNALGIFIYPTILLVDPVSKKIYFSSIGSKDITDLEKNINALLNTK